MNIDLKFYFRLLIRRLPVMTALLLICVGLSIAMAVRLPTTYSTSARLLVEAPQIPDSLAASTIRTDASEQLQVIEQQLMTRANLIDVANRFNAFPKIRSMSPDEVVERMQEHTRIRRTGGVNQATLMSLSFEAEDPAAAANVVNEYVTIILDLNARFRLEGAEATLDFFEQEVERLGLELDLQSAEIVSFKVENQNALPDDLEYRQERQSFLQERLARLERDKSSLQDQRRQIVALFESTGRIQRQDDVQATEEVQQLDQLRRELNQALAIYSETNPRIVLLKSRITKLEAIVAEQEGVGEEDQGDQQTTILELTLTEIDTELEGFDRGVSETTQELAVLLSSIQATPANGIQLGTLERDYSNTQDLYNAAVASLSEARMGERIEVTSKGQRVTVIESANVPNKPSGPNRSKIIAAGVAAGIGLAAGFFMLLELLNRTIRRPAEIVNRFNITPIATIPFMESSVRRWARRGALVTTFVAVLIGVPAGLWAIDTHYMPLELLVTKLSQRLGFS